MEFDSPTIHYLKNENMKDKIYYSDYDVFVDIETGEFLDMCTCDEKEHCTYKQAWIDDGRPERLSRKILKGMIIEEGERMMK